LLHDEAVFKNDDAINEKSLISLRSDMTRAVGSPFICGRRTVPLHYFVVVVAKLMLSGNDRLAAAINSTWRHMDILASKVVIVHVI